MTNNYFVNPYNFVSLEGICDKQNRKNIKGKLTGKILCTLKTLTPIFIPEDKKDMPDMSDVPDVNCFFHYPDTNTPVIPGSEIRGMIRSVFEAAFNGCLSQINDAPFHRRSMEAKKPGLLYKSGNEWKLEECERVMLNTKYFSESTSIYKKHGKYIDRESISTGQSIYIKKSSQRYQARNEKARNYTPYVVKEYSFTNSTEYERGIIYLGGEFNNKHHESVFLPIEKNKAKSLNSQTIKTFRDVLSLYIKNSESKQNKGPYVDCQKLLDKITKSNELTTRKLKLPVYYSLDEKNNISYLAPAIFSQEVFQNTVINILQEHGNYQPCNCKEELCPACHLFGFVKEKDMAASRIRFSDALPQDEISFSKSIKLPALGQPNPGAVEFYTNRPNSLGERGYWTYDYKIVGKKRVVLKASDIVIRGRKFYWHHLPDSSYLLKNKESKGEMEITIQPVDKNNFFEFTVYFEGITEKELNQLCNTLDINTLKDHAHKIGRGKPLGFGSVQIEINDIVIRKIRRETGRVEQHNKKRAELKNYIIKNADLLNILNFKNDFSKRIVSYPKVQEKKTSVSIKENDTASHRWFTINNNNKRKIDQVLPTVQEEISGISNKWLKVKKL